MTDLWRFREDVGADRTFVPAGLVTAIDVDNESLKVDRTKDEIKGAPDFEAGTGKDPAYRDAVARHHGA